MVKYDDGKIYTMDPFGRSLIHLVFSPPLRTINVKGDFDFGFFLANLMVFGSSSNPQFSITIGHLTKLGHI